MTTHADNLWIGTTGTTCFIEGERGTVRGVHRVVGPQSQNHRHVVVVLDERPAVLWCEAVTDEKGHQATVINATEVTRDQFDDLAGITDLRSEMGWVA